MSASATLFPKKLYDLLELGGHSHVISWSSSGRGVLIHDKTRFENELVQLFLGKQSKYRSFLRRLLRWGFKRLKDGPDKGAYFHDHFRKGQPELLSQIVPVDPKGGPSLSEPSSPTRRSAKQRPSARVRESGDVSTMSDSTAAVPEYPDPLSPPTQVEQKLACDSSCELTSPAPTMSNTEKEELPVGDPLPFHVASNEDFATHFTRGTPQQTFFQGTHAGLDSTNKFPAQGRAVSNVFQDYEGKPQTSSRESTRYARATIVQSATCAVDQEHPEMNNYREISQSTLNGEVFSSSSSRGEFPLADHSHSEWYYAARGGPHSGTDTNLSSVVNGERNGTGDTFQPLEDITPLKCSPNSFPRHDPQELHSRPGTLYYLESHQQDGHYHHHREPQNNFSNYAFAGNAAMALDKAKNMARPTPAYPNAYHSHSHDLPAESHRAVQHDPHSYFQNGVAGVAAHNHDAASFLAGPSSVPSMLHIHPTYNHNLASTHTAWENESSTSIRSADKRDGNGRSSPRSWYYQPETQQHQSPLQHQYHQHSRSRHRPDQGVFKPP